MKRAFVGFRFDSLTIDEAIGNLAARTEASAFEYVVTPNVDHAVRLAEAGMASETHDAYSGAMYCLCDSRVLAKLARLRGLHLDIVPGSDLTANLLFQTLRPGDRIAVLGSSAGAVDVLRARLPQVEIGHLAPPMGLLDNPVAMSEAVEFVVGSKARYVLLAVGSPQQEIIAHRAFESGRARGTGLCIGASIDFLTEQRKRAPKWVQRLSLEWLHRLLSEPRRLWRRYLVRGPKIVPLVFSNSASEARVERNR